MSKNTIMLFVSALVSFFSIDTIACSTNTVPLTVNLGTISQTNVSTVAVGTVIKTLEGKWDSYGSNVAGSCGATTLISYSMPGGNLADGYTNVYTTNLQGIGIRLSVWAVGYATYGIGGGYYGTPTSPTPLPLQLPVQNLAGGGAYGTGYNQLRIELIKTASNWQGGTLLVAGPILTLSDQSGTIGPSVMDNITINATLNLPSCSVTTPSLTVDLGSVRMPDIVFATPAAGKAFTIEMTCSANPKVSIQFDGLAVVGNPKVLQLRNEPGVATGIGLQIVDSKGNAVTIGQGMPLIDAAPSGINKYQFTARYVPIATHRTPGTADANATFTMDYN
jgi:type 1 fimbria pilin